MANSKPDTPSPRPAPIEPNEAPKPEEAPAKLLDLRDTDDVLVRGVKRSIHWARINSRSLLVVVVLAGLAVSVLLVMRQNAAETVETAWHKVLAAETPVQISAAIEELDAGSPVRPHGLLRLAEAYLADQEGDRIDNLERAIQALSDFATLVGTDAGWEDELASSGTLRVELQQNLAVRKAREVLIDAAGTLAGGDEATVDPEPEVIAPRYVDGAAVPSDNPFVVFRTEHGDLKIEIFANEVPNAAAVVLRLVASGYYDLTGPGYLVATDGLGAFAPVVLGTFLKTTGEDATRTRTAIEADDATLKRLGAEWNDAFAVRSVGWTVPFERRLGPSGERIAPRAIVEGAVVMALDETTGLAQVHSAATRLAIYRQAAPSLAGQRVVVGQVSEASLSVLRRLQAEDEIENAWISRTLPQLREREIVAAVRGEEGVSYEAVTPVPYGSLLDPYTLVPEDARAGARYLELRPGQVERIPAGSAYYPPTSAGLWVARTVVAEELTYTEWTLAEGAFEEHAGEVVRTADGVAYVEWFAAESALTGLLLPVMTPVLDADGALVPRDWQPRVRFLTVTPVALAGLTDETDDLAPIGDKLPAPKPYPTLEDLGANWPKRFGGPDASEDDGTEPDEAEDGEGSEAGGDAVADDEATDLSGE